MIHLTVPAATDRVGISISCTNDAMIYSLMLYALGAPGDEYRIEDDGMRVGMTAIAHDEASLGDVREPVELVGLTALPVLFIPEPLSLVIPVQIEGTGENLNFIIDMVHSRMSTCSADIFIPGEVTVGALFPRDANFGGFGDIMLGSAMIGVHDFNAYLGEIGEEWRLDLAIYDTAELGVISSVRALYEDDIRVHLGPPYTYELLELDGSSLAISCCGTSSILDVAQDGIFRTAPSDGKVGAALAERIFDDGVRVVIPVRVADVWNNGYLDDVTVRFEELGGTVDHGITFEPVDPTAGLMQEINEKIEFLATEYGEDNLAILSLPLDDIRLFRAASNSAGLDAVRWYGTDYTALDARYTDDPEISRFASAVQYTAMQVTTPGGYEEMRERLGEIAGKVTNHDMLASYESAWLLGLSILYSYSTDPDVLEDVIPYVATRYTGTMGPMTLDENGDLAASSFEAWTVRDGKWTMTGNGGFS